MTPDVFTIADLRASANIPLLLPLYQRTSAGVSHEWGRYQVTRCMVRPCVASGFAELAVSGLASMYPAFDWSICSGPSWISARVRSHYRTGLDWTIWVTSVRTCSEDRTSISSHPLADLGWKLLIGLRHRLFITCSSYRAVPLFEPGAVPSSRPAERRSRRAQGRSRSAVALTRSSLCRCQAAPWRPRARREDQAGRTPASSVLVSSKARPLASTAQAMRASLLASAIASTLWCNRFLAASIQDLSP